MFTLSEMMAGYRVPFSRRSSFMMDFHAGQQRRRFELAAHEAGLVEEEFVELYEAAPREIAAVVAFPLTRSVGLGEQRPSRLRIRAPPAGTIG